MYLYYCRTLYRRSLCRVQGHISRSVQRPKCAPSPATRRSCSSPATAAWRCCCCWPFLVSTTIILLLYLLRARTHNHRVVFFLFFFHSLLFLQWKYFSVEPIRYRIGTPPPPPSSTTCSVTACFFMVFFVFFFSPVDNIIPNALFQPGRGELPPETFGFGFFVFCSVKRVKIVKTSMSWSWVSGRGFICSAVRKSVTKRRWAKLD